RGGHPCLWLTVPTAKPVADFHRQVIAHAGRTIKKPLPFVGAAFKQSTFYHEYYVLCYIY
ncbi:hypothetical protein, partial [Paenibacillus lactis]